MKTWKVVLIWPNFHYIYYIYLPSLVLTHLGIKQLMLKKSWWFWKSKSQFSFPVELFLSNYSVCIWSVVETHSPHELVVQPLSPAGSSPHLPPSHTAERTSHLVPSHGSGGKYLCALESAPPCDQLLTAALIYLHKSLNANQLFINWLWSKWRFIRPSWTDSTFTSSIESDKAISTARVELQTSVTEQLLSMKGERQAADVHISAVGMRC